MTMPQEFHELLTESFKEVDIEDQDYIEIHQLRGVLDVLVEDEVIKPFCEAELEQLTADMDAFNSGKISLSEFLDILTRRAKGADFTDAELEEAFKCFKVEEKEVSFGAKELRQVMAALCDVEISAKEADIMIQGAAKEPGQTHITFEEFKSILYWQDPSEKREPGVHKWGSDPQPHVTS